MEFVHTETGWGIYDFTALALPHIAVLATRARVKRLCNHHQARTSKAEWGGSWSQLTAGSGLWCV